MNTAALIAKIDVWCRRTGQPESLIGTAVLNHAGFASQLRTRGTLKPATAEKVVSFLNAYPDKNALPFEIAQELKLAAKRGQPWQPPIASQSPRGGGVQDGIVASRSTTGSGATGRG